MQNRRPKRGSLLRSFSNSTYWIGVFFSTLVLVSLWVSTILNLVSGKAWSHQNAWGVHFGSYTIFVLLLIGTPIYVYAIWKFWPSRKQQNNRKKRKNKRRIT